MNRFIDRPLVMEKIKEWILDSGNQKSVLSLVGPPGSGKTTLLSMLANSHLQGVKVFSLPFPSDFFQDDHISEEQARRLLGRLLSITPDPHATPTAILQEWVRRYCETYTTPIPLFLADGYDEISDSLAEEYSRKILEPIISFACTRLIVARREDSLLQSLVLSLHQTRLHLNEFRDINADFARRQFEKLGGGSVSSDDIQNWMERFIEYRWENPLLNELLFLKAAGDGKLNAPEASIIREVIEEAVTRSGKFPQLTEPQFSYLCILARLEEQWSGREAEQALRISDFYLNKDIIRLGELGLIVDIENSIKHMLASGFRGLLREFNRLSGG